MNPDAPTPVALNAVARRLIALHFVAVTPVALNSVAKNPIAPTHVPIWTVVLSPVAFSRFALNMTCGCLQEQIGPDQQRWLLSLCLSVLALLP